MNALIDWGKIKTDSGGSVEFESWDSVIGAIISANRHHHLITTTTDCDALVDHDPLINMKEEITVGFTFEAHGR